MRYLPYAIIVFFLFFAIPLSVHGRIDNNIVLDATINQIGSGWGGGAHYLAFNQQWRGVTGPCGDGDYYDVNSSDSWEVGNRSQVNYNGTLGRNDSDIICLALTGGSPTLLNTYFNDDSVGFTFNWSEPRLIKELLIGGVDIKFPNLPYPDCPIASNEMLGATIYYEDPVTLNIVRDDWYNFTEWIPLNSSGACAVYSNSPSGTYATIYSVPLNLNTSFLKIVNWSTISGAISDGIEQIAIYNISLTPTAPTVEDVISVADVCDESDVYCVFYEPFNYSDALVNHGWVHDGASSKTPSSGTLVVADSEPNSFGDVYRHAFDSVDRNSFFAFNLSMDDPDGFGVAQVSSLRFDGNNLITELLTMIAFNDPPNGLTLYSENAFGDLVSDVVCTGCVDNGTMHQYEVDIYFSDPSESVIDNGTPVQILEDTAKIKIDGDVVGYNLDLFPQDVSEFSIIDFIFVNGTNFVLDNVTVMYGEGIENFGFNNSVPNISLQDFALVEEEFAGFKSVGGKYSGFDCDKYAQCCSLVRGEVKVTSQMCVLGVIGESFLDSVGSWILSNFFRFIVLIVITVFGLFVYIKLREA